MNRRNIFILITLQLILIVVGVKAQTTISPLVGEAIRAFRNNEFETAREKADKAILSGNYSMNQRRDLYYIRGYGLFLASNYPEAMKDFDMVLDIKMNDKQSQLLKAECYYYMNKFDNGIEEFNNAEKLWKSTDDNFNNMTAYIKAMRGKCQYKLGKYEVALNELNRALLLDSTVMDTWETFGDVNFTLKNFDTALFYYSKAIELYKLNNDNSIYGWVSRGKVYDSLTKHDAAILNYKEAIRIKSFEREPYWLTAESYEKKKNIDSSLIYFQEALARTDSEDVANLKLLNWQIGSMYKKNNKFDEAITYFQKALTLDDHYKEAYADIADCYVENKQYKQSIEPYERAIIVYQQDKKDSLILSSLYLKLGDVYNKTKNETKAKENFLSALKWNKGNNSASMMQANVLYANKKYKESLPFFKKVIENPIASDPIVLQEAYYKQGMCYLDTKDTGQAIASFQKSTDFKTTHDEAQVKLSEIYFAKKQFDKLGGLLTSLDSSAKKFDTTALAEMYYKKGVSNLTGGNAAEAKNDFTKCINFNGNIKKAYHGLADACMQTKEYAAAEEAYTQCIELYKNEKDSLYKMYLYRAQAKSKLNNFSEAVGDIEAANRLKSGNLNVSKSLIETHIAAGNFEKAIELANNLQKSLKTTDLNNIAYCYYYKAQCNIGLSNTDKAMNDLAKALSYNRNFVEAQKLQNNINANPDGAASLINPKDSTNSNPNNGSSVSIPTGGVPTPIVAVPSIGKSTGKKDKKTKKGEKSKEVKTEPTVDAAKSDSTATALSETKKDTVATAEKKVVAKKEKKPKKGTKGVEVKAETDSSSLKDVSTNNQLIEPKKDAVFSPPVPVAEPVKKDTVVTPPAPVVEPKKDTIIATPVTIAEPVKKDTVVNPPAPVAEPKKDPVIVPPAPVAEPVKKDTVVTPQAPVVEPKKDTIITAPVPVAEPAKKDTVVTPPAPIVEPKKDSVITPPVPVAEPVMKDTVVAPPAPVAEPVKKDTVITPPAPVVVPKKDPVITPPVPEAEPVMKDTVVTPPAPVVVPKKDTIIAPPVPLAEPVKKDTVVAPPALVVEPKKDPVIVPPAPVAEPVKKDTVVTPQAPVVEPKKDTVIAPPVPVAEPAKKDTVVTPPAPIVEPKKDSVIAPIVPVIPKVDSAKVEVNRDSTLPKEPKKENDHLLNEDPNENGGNRKNNPPATRDANKEYNKEQD